METKCCGTCRWHILEDGDVDFSCDNSDSNEDIAVAVEKAVRFLVVMADAGYVTISEEQETLDGLDTPLHHDPL